MIHKAETTNEIPAGWLRMYQVSSEEEASKVANGREAWLYESKIIDALYLFVPETEAA